VGRLSDVEISTVVPAPQDRVWERIASVAGVNHELGPLVRMTAPPGVDEIDIDSVPLGELWFRSRVLVLGVPLDYDDLAIVELEPGRRFLERSSMRSMRVWQHERVLDPAGEAATRVTDRLTFATRGPIPHALARAVVRALFRHRHRRLAAWFSASGRAP
jgi:ligand-binding SRPBCC domain-containing protein